MTTRTHATIRSQIRGTLTKLGGGRAFTDSEDVFARGVVRSLNLLELIGFVESEYGLEVSQRDVFDGHLRSVDSLVGFVSSRLQVVA